MSRVQYGSLGGVAKWLCSGLQSRLHRFDSDPRLQMLTASLAEAVLYLSAASSKRQLGRHADSRDGECVALSSDRK